MPSSRIQTDRGIVHVTRRGTPNVVVIYVHGDNVEGAPSPYIDYVWGSGHKINEQIARGIAGGYLAFGIEAPDHRDESIVWPDLDELRMLADDNGARGKPIIAIAHSRGYTTVAKWLGHPHLKHVLLLDALFGSVDKYRAWAAAGGDLVTVGATGKPLENSEAIAQSKGVRFVRSSEGHMGVVTNGRLIPELLPRFVGGSLIAGILLLAAAGAAYIWARRQG